MKNYLKHGFDRMVSLTLAMIMLFSCVSLADTSAQAAERAEADYVFTDYTSGYHLTEFLTGYNVIAFGNAKMDVHCMGSVIIQGSLSGSMSGYSDGVNLPPSYIKGLIEAPNAVYNSRADASAPPLYVGSVNTVSSTSPWGNDNYYTVNGLASSYNGQPPIYVSDDFFNFSEAYEVIKADQATMVARGTVVKPDASGVITVNVGDNVIIESLDGVNSINIIGDMNALVNTTINILDSGDVNAPLEYINGSQQQVMEQNTAGTSIVFNFPNAESVKLPTWTWIGHVIAPDADVTQDSGNYNGCIICKNLFSAAEGHVYNYNTTDTSWETVYSLEKVWNDGHNADGLRPDSIQVQLLANGQAYGDPVTLSAANEWAHVWPVLPEKDAAGNLITYTAQEVVVPTGYTSEYNPTNQTLINTHDYEEVDITVTKKWAGESSFGSRMRPVKLTVYLYADGVKVDEQTITVTDAATQTITFTGLPKNKAGKAIVYSVEESQVAGYTGTTGAAVVDPADPSQISIDLTNTWNVESVEVSGKKTWNDDNDRDGLRPTEITVQLLANGTVVHEHIAKASDGWTYSFTNLPKTDAQGNAITYTVREKAVPAGYTVSVDGYDLINDHAIITVDLSGAKTWNDDDDNDGKRPESITVILLADHAEVARKTVTAADGWKWEFKDMPANYAGKPITYTVQELTVEGYTSVHSGLNLTNTHENETVDVSGAKTWADDNNNDGKRPESIVINLLQDGKTYKTVTVTEKDGWKWSFSDLPRYTDGHEHVYTITEEPVAGYTTTVSGYDVTNTHENETVDVLGLKVWNDNSNNDGKRPNYLTIYLTRDGVRTGDTRTTNAQNNWYWLFEDMPKYEDGHEFVYGFEEEAVEGYTGPVITRMTTLPEGYGDIGYTLTNTHEDETVSISGAKTWDDANNQDGKRPESITIRLWATVDSAARDNHTEVAHKTVTAADNWAWDFGELPRYADGKEILYTITEDVVEGYSTQINGYDVTNRDEPSKITVSGVKYWVDGNDQDGLRPASITVHLLADGKEISKKTVTAADGWKWSFTDLDEYKAGRKIVYTITEDVVPGYTTVVDDHDLINTHTPETVSVSGAKTWVDADNQDGLRPVSIIIRLWKTVDGKSTEVRTAVVTASHDWKWSFVDLPRYEAGKLITYTITEDAVPGYTTVIRGYDATNTHETETVDISGSKTWIDNNDQDGKRPDEITIRLWATVGASHVNVKTLTVTEADGWKWSFTDLPRYQGGKEITYTITEDPVTDYSARISGYDVTNSYTPGKVDISGMKYWVDNDDQDGIRPDSITIRLLADGAEVARKTVTEKDGWKWVFADLPEYKDGAKITYTLTEDTVEGYTTVIDQYDVINTHEPRTIDLLGQKIWDDNDNNDGLRPVRLNVYLTRNGVRTGDYRTTNAERSWYWIFRKLPVYENGKEIEYGFEEETVPGYKWDGTLTAIDMTRIPAGYGDRGLALTNRHEDELTEIKGSKTWDDMNNQDGKRPESITIRLWATVGSSHTNIRTLTVKPDANGVWSWNFTGLPVYEDGLKITYTITEDAVAGYSTEIDGFDVINTDTPSKVSISGVKYWLDANDQDGIRPESITVNLLADGVEVAQKTVTARDGWKWVFADLDEYRDGVKIVYTITEDKVEGYDTYVDQYDLINTHVPETVEFSGQKTWDDADDQDGKRPASITIRLWKTVDGKTTELRAAVSTAARDWKWSFVNLPKYEAGKLITYTITEDKVEGYTTVIDGFDAVNTHKTETVDISGSKTWADNNNQDGKRPVYITINLLADGQLVKKMNVYEKDGWKWSFAGMPRYKGGKEITYTITEDKVEGYTATVNGYDVTNTHVTELIGVHGYKLWEDDNNRDLMRPDSIVINLLANGVEVAEKTVTAANGWMWSFTDLPKYEAGREIRYTITEDKVEGYDAQVDGYIVTNSHHTLQLAAAGVKVWQDARNRSGIRPTEIVLHLLADGVEIATKTVDATTDWHYDFGSVPKYDHGREIVYTIIEEPVAGYYSLVRGFNLTNTEVVFVDGSKTWVDDNNSAGSRPESIVINLLADGVEVDEVTVTAENNWAWNFSYLPRYNDKDEEITYTITEDKVPGYITEINGYDVTNRFDATDFTVTKIWEGGYGGEIDLTLYANGERVNPQPAYDRLDDVYRWENLPKYDADGKEIIYSATERYMDGYMTIYKNYGDHADKTKAVYDGGEIINRKVTSVYVRKVWSGLAEGEEAPDITLTLYCNGEKVDKKTPEPDEYGWYRYYNLPVTRNGVTAVYTVAEEPLEGFIVTYQTANGEEAEIAHNGDTITNTRVPQTGDRAPLALWAVMLIASAAALLILKRRRT